MIRKHHPVNRHRSQCLVIPAIVYIDIFNNECYSVSNIPAKPLPQGKRNLAGLFLGAE